MSQGNAIYAQSGGVTSVINTTAAGVIDNWPRNRLLYAAKNGILGLLHENFCDAGALADSEPSFTAKLRHTPGGVFGSARYKLKPLAQDENTYRRLFAVCDAHSIRTVFYNGGNDSQDTSAKITEAADKFNYPITCIGLPKTIDNDLAMTDFCPGYPSAARYIALATAEASHDVAAMCATSTKVFVMEVMGRNAGWLAAAGGVAQCPHRTGADLIILPEAGFSTDIVCQAIDKTIADKGYCVLVVSEGARYETGELLAAAGTSDSFGHPQLGGSASVLADLVQSLLKHKVHYAVPDYLQRAARFTGSAVDVEMAYQVGKAGVEAVLANSESCMIALQRSRGANGDLVWHTKRVPLQEVANAEKTLPPEFISDCGLNISDACRNWLLPLVQRGAEPQSLESLPTYAKLPPADVAKKLPPWTTR